MLARRNVGVPVFAGMIAASCLGIFLIPPLCVTFQGLREQLKPSSRPRPAAGAAALEAEPAHKARHGELLHRKLIVKPIPVRMLVPYSAAQPAFAAPRPSPARITSAAVAKTPSS
jgi:hypothetical protein